MASEPMSTAEALAQFARELDAQTQTVPTTITSEEWGGEVAAVVSEAQDVPVFSTATRDRIVIEAARSLLADQLDLRGE